MKSLITKLLKIFLYRNHALVIMFLALFFSITIFGYQILSYQTNISKDRYYCNKFIEQYQGKLTDKKIDDIEKINDFYQEDNYAKYINDYKNGYINENEYLYKQNQLTKSIEKQGGFQLFYKQYQTVKNNNNLEICDNQIPMFFSMRNFDYASIIFTIFMIYMCILNDYDKKMTIHEVITSGGRKYLQRSKIIIFILLVSTFIIVNNFIKASIINAYCSLDISIYNINWINSETINITLRQYYIIGTVLQIIASILLSIFATYILRVIKKTSLTLISIFLTCYVSKAFFGNDAILLYFPFVSFLIPGNYFSKMDELNAFNPNHIIILVVLSLIFILISFIKSKKRILLIVCVFMFCGCEYKSINLNTTYNSYQNINIGLSNNYLYFNEELIDKNTLLNYSIYRDPLIKEQNLYSVNVFANHIIYNSGDEKDKQVYNLDLDNFSLNKIINVSTSKRNYLNINEDNTEFDYHNAYYKILGDSDEYIYVYDNQVSDKYGNVLFKGDFSNTISLWENCIYSLQRNGQIVKYSLKTKTNEIVDTVLSDYFFIKDNKIYCHSIKDNKIYEQRKLILDVPVSNFDIQDNMIYYDNQNGIHCFNLVNNEDTLISCETGYSILADENYLYYITDSTNVDKNIVLNIYDLKGKIVIKQIEA